MVRRPSLRRRSGSALLETALVLPVLFFFLFVIIEMSLYIMVQHVTNVACMAADRLAVVSTGESTVTSTTITDKCKATMGGVIKLISNGTPTVSVTGEVTTQNPTGDWKQSAFGDGITVSVQGSYKLVTPWKVFFINGWNVSCNATMSSEAN